MKKWLRRSLIASALIGVTFGVLYEVSTHTVRGWWNGEAIFQGRPTSYWAARIDSWVERFDTPDDAEKYMRAHRLDGLLSSTAILYTPPRPTFWNKVRGWFGLPHADDGHPPEILREFDVVDAAPVHDELEKEPRFKRFVDLARKPDMVW
jgi:hypothetical protein